MELLSKTQYKDGLVAPLPSNVVTSHKFGERNFAVTGEKQLHECGIVYVPNKPYVLCVMTTGKNFQQLAETIREVSRMTYEQRIQ